MEQKEKGTSPYGPALKENDMQQQQQQPLSIGESRVRINFNVSGSTVVDQFKQDTARLINMVDSLRADASGEKVRLISLAQTAYEEAAMWAVKAATM